MKLEPFKAYTIEDDEHTFGYTVYWPAVEVPQDSTRTHVTGKVWPFYGWVFFPDDSGHIIDHKPFGRHFIEFELEEDVQKYFRYKPTERMDNKIMHSMLYEIFENRKKQ